MNTKLFDFNAGLKAMSENNEVLQAYFVVVLGNVTHWVWEVLIAGLTSGDYNFGGWLYVLVRIIVSFIAAAFSFTGIYKQLESADPKLRLFVAFTQGFAIDAFTGPAVSGLQPSPS